jgi:hypothetical protein
MPSTQAEPASRPRGNPNLHLAPRCGARTRTGCPCRAPAIHGRRRCRMHGGRSTGPRTEEGLQRLRAAHTVHGRYAAAARAEWRHDRVMLTRIRVLCDAARFRAWLPADMAARLEIGPAELGPPPHPGWGTPPYIVDGRVLRGRLAERMAARAEADALAPWRAAIAAARTARREARAGVAAPADGVPGTAGLRSSSPQCDGTGQRAHAPDSRRDASGERAPRPHAPVPGASAFAADHGAAGGAPRLAAGDRARLAALVAAELAWRVRATAHAPVSAPRAAAVSADPRAPAPAPARGGPGAEKVPASSASGTFVAARSGPGLGPAAKGRSHSVQFPTKAHAPVPGAAAAGRSGDFGARSPCTSARAAPPFPRRPPA